jgi:ribosomal protein L24
MPMRDAEVNQILNRVEEGEEAPRTLISFDIGEKVKVTDGPFEGFDGMVEEVDEDHQRLKVSVSIFGRATPVELNSLRSPRSTERSPVGGEAVATAGPDHVNRKPSGRVRRGVEKGEATWPRKSPAR